MFGFCFHYFHFCAVSKIIPYGKNPLTRPLYKPTPRICVPQICNPINIPNVSPSYILRLEYWSIKFVKSSKHQVY